MTDKNPNLIYFQNKNFNAFSITVFANQFELFLISKLLTLINHNQSLNVYCYNNSKKYCGELIRFCFQSC